MQRENLTNQLNGRSEFRNLRRLCGLKSRQDCESDAPAETVDLDEQPLSIVLDVFVFAVVKL